MTYHVRTEQRPTPTGRSTVYVLEDDRAGSRAEVWPAFGFNCASWTVAAADGPRELLWSDPGLLAGGHPTRCGIPVLFPFPNRIRDGRFNWDGRTYQLPWNGPQGRHAIHGFAATRPWRVLASGSGDGAWVRGVFQISADAPECAGFWPGDLKAEAVYQLLGTTLRLQLGVYNPSPAPVPFGVGLHPYFRCRAAGTRVRLGTVEAGLAGAGELRQWVLEDCLPTGELRLPVGRQRALAAGTDDARPLGPEPWDDAFRLAGPADGTNLHAWLFDPDTRRGLEVKTAGGFRDVVIFTPPHGEAVCVEPYTCITDAVNLQARGVDAGLRLLRPGGWWEGTVRLTSLTEPS